MGKTRKCFFHQHLHKQLSENMSQAEIQALVILNEASANFSFNADVLTL